MYIIIIGAGDVGYNLAKTLCYERHDVVIIEKGYEAYNRAADSLDAQVIHDNGCSFTVLEKAGVENADLLVAVTDSDEANLLAGMMAKQYHVGKTVVRVKNREFLRSDSPVNAQKLGIDLIIHPESIAAHGAVRLLRQSVATDIIEFAGGEIILMGIQLDKNTPILKRRLIDLAQDYRHLAFRTVAIQRKDITRIPHGQDVLLENDRIFVTIPKDRIAEVLQITGKENIKLENIMILGGGQVGYLVARELERNHNIKVIESNQDKSENLAEKLRKSLVIHGDGRDLNLLALEGIIDMDAFIALTGDDETNLIACLMAKHLQVPKIISLINKVEYSPIIPTIGINSYISKQLLTVNQILKFIRRGDIVNVASIPGITAEAIELIPKPGSKVTTKPLAELKFPRDAIVGAVMREHEFLIPTGETQLQPGDQVVLFAMPAAIHEVEKLFN